MVVRPGMRVTRATKTVSDSAENDVLCGSSGGATLIVHRVWGKTVCNNCIHYPESDGKSRASQPDSVDASTGSGAPVSIHPARLVEALAAREESLRGCDTKWPSVPPISIHAVIAPR